MSSGSLVSRNLIVAIGLAMSLGVHAASATDRKPLEFDVPRTATITVITHPDVYPLHLNQQDWQVTLVGKDCKAASNFVDLFHRIYAVIGVRTVPCTYTVTLKHYP
jgi:hypothetical protein